MTISNVRFTLQVMDDPRIKQLRELCQQAMKLKEAAEELVVQLTGQLERSISTHDDRGNASSSDRRRQFRA